MKKNQSQQLSTVILFIIYSLNSFVYSQDKIILPLKNDYIYYSFDNDLTNKRKCLSSYFDMLGSSFSIKISSTHGAIFSSSKLNFSNYSGNFGLLHTNYSINCVDTLEGESMLFNVILPSKVKLLYNKPASATTEPTQSIQCAIQIIFYDKNRYSIRFKGFTYKQTYLRKGNLVTDVFPLEEVYNLYFSDLKSNKNQTELYSDLDLMINSFGNLINETLIKIYKQDDL